MDGAVGLAQWLANVRTAEVEVSPDCAWSAPPFSGPLLRSAVGLAAHRLGCAAAGCAGEAHADGCGFRRFFHGEGSRPPPFRLDTSGVDGRRHPAGGVWSLRLTTYDPDAAEFLYDAVSMAMSTGLGRDRVRHDVRRIVPVHEGEGEGVMERGARWAGRTLRVRLSTPTSLQRRGAPVAEPTALDLLHAVRFRARNLGAPLAELPRYEDAVAVREAHVRRDTLRWEGIQMPVIRAEWAIVPTPTQAVWLALGEQTGVGKHAAFGMGAVGCSVG